MNAKEKAEKVKITQSVIDNLKPPAKTDDDKPRYVLHWDDKLLGFGVRVTSAGAISYIAQARVNGKERRITLGRAGVLTPTEARKKAKTVLGEMANGVDSVADSKIKQAETITLREVTADYVENRKNKQGLPLKQSTINDIERHIDTTFSAWADKPVGSITRDMVSKLYNARSGTSIAQANQSMRVLSALIRYAIATNRRADGSPIITDNPVEVLRDSKILAAVKKRTTKVPPKKRGEWWAEIQRRRQDPALATASKTAVDLIAFIALTGLRLTEAKTLKWSQVDLENKSFELIDTKNRRDVIFPLSDIAHEMLAERYDEKADYVFPGRSTGHIDNPNKQFKVINKVTGVEVTAHPLRRTFIQIGLKELELELWRVKALSNHKQNQDVTLSDYGDLTDVRFLKSEADKIANYYEQQRAEFEADNVVSIEAKRA